MITLSRKAAAIEPSVTLEISAKAKAMKAEGKKIVAFTAGEPDFDTPVPIVEAAKKALDDGYTKYTPAAGLPELKRAICEKFLSAGADRRVGRGEKLAVSRDRGDRGRGGRGDRSYPLLGDLRGTDPPLRRDTSYRGNDGKVRL